MLELVGLERHFGKEPNVVRAVDGINCQINRGEFVSIVGRSGSGKTTLLDCAGLLIRPSAGTVVIEGIDTSRLSDGKRAILRSRELGFIFQGYNLLPSLSAMENALLPLRYSGGDKTAARRRAEDLFEEIGLAGRMNHRPAQLSGGEQQRVAIVRAVVNEPKLVLADEPTGEVDSETSLKLLAAMRRMNSERGVTFLIVTHDSELASRTDRQIQIRDGRILSDARNQPQPNGEIMNPVVRIPAQSSAH